ncbi:MAG: YkoF family thiamine/hydroxymethylpyrimidine-binding protein [Sedimentisphaerales bacterium]
MKVQAEISLYPLRCSNLTEPIRQFVELLETDKLKVEIGPMSTLVTGDRQVVFENLNKAFERLAEEYKVVMIAKISNACPRC